MATNTANASDTVPEHSVAPSQGLRTLVICLLIIALTVVVDVMFLRSGGWGDALGLIRVAQIAVAVLFTLFMVRCLFRAIRADTTDPLATRFHLPATRPEDYLANGLGPQALDATGSVLYLDLMKRSVTNILYEDAPLAFYDQHQQPVMANGFDLKRRVHGEDLPTLALTMVGMKRLDNLQDCIEKAIQNDIPGDVVETGVLCGGASIFARSVLRAHGVTDRRVFVCDAFVPPQPPLPRWKANVVGSIIQVVASVPSRTWQRRVLKRLQSQAKEGMFPLCEDPSDELVGFFMWLIRHPQVLLCQRATGLSNVRSHFARFGLLDEQVVFLKGFFSETLPDAPIEQVAVLRLDGDTYESTMDVLEILYPKLSPGGFCIIDDFHAFSDCRRAVEEYRAAQHIHDEIQPIDHVGVFWQKS